MLFRSTNLNYSMTNEQLDIIIPEQWINRDALAYPIIIDPIVTVTDSLDQASIAGSGYTATFATGGCPYNLPIVVPANITVTDIRWSFCYMTGTNPSCWLEDGAIDFTLDSCRSPSPGIWWTCQLPNPGTCVGTNEIGRASCRERV